MHNPSQFCGPDLIRVDFMSKEELQQELCSMYVMAEALVDADSFKDIGIAIDNLKAYMASDNDYFYEERQSKNPTN